MAYDPVRFLVVRDYLKFLNSLHWQEQPPKQLVEQQDRRFYFQLLQGMIRHQRLLEEEVRKRLTKPFHKLEKSVRGILMLGIFQLFFMDKIPARASIYETVELSIPFRVKRQKALINAVLRNLQRDLEIAYSYEHYPLAIRTSHQEWMIKHWEESYSETEIQSICTANNLFEGILVRVIAPWTRDELQQALLKENVTSAHHPLIPQALLIENASGLLQTSVFQQGACYVQDGSSQIFLELTTPLWQGHVLDVCAAPGGKSFQVIQSPQLKTLTINDISQKRLKRVRENWQRIGISKEQLVVSDGKQLPFKSQFDTILLDVPCSSTGTLRKNPHLKWTLSIEKLLSQTSLQKQLLAHAVEYLKPGGHLVYATCSLEIEENEQQIEHFLEHHPNFSRLPFSKLLKVPDPYLPYLTEEGFYKTLPSSLLMGFFAAVLLHNREGN